MAVAVNLWISLCVAVTLMFLEVTLLVTLALAANPHPPGRLPMPRRPLGHVDADPSGRVTRIAIARAMHRRQLTSGLVGAGLPGLLTSACVTTSGAPPGTDAGGGFLATHPATTDRIEALRNVR